ncbi:tRNA (cytidine/uridine-2'-O-)-methyltransferase [Lachnospiraceae bacterium]|nr:tRNA (cytidine/uridine-2'-O-)-methyltransferase [Lachnospiraceae bacterium]
MLNIVLHEPEIPQNTGNIGRTCVITGARLHLIRPLGFRINEKTVKRAGLDYWPKLDVTEHDNVEAFYRYVEESDKKSVEDINELYADRNIEKNPKIYYATTKGKHRYTDVEFHDGDYIMFGRESAGIPEEILAEHPDECIRIPMLPEERSLNLANSVAIVLYEALRQLDFPGLEDEGELHRLKYINEV